jgi:hypothetical protein
VKHAPDKSIGGTFHFDAKRNFVHHEPATQPRPEPPIEIPPPDTLNPDPGPPQLNPDPGSPGLHPDPGASRATPRSKKE